MSISSKPFTHSIIFCGLHMVTFSAIKTMGTWLDSARLNQCLNWKGTTTLLSSGHMQREIPALERNEAFHWWIYIQNFLVHTPYRTQFFHFHIYFHRKAPASEVHTPPPQNRFTPPTGNPGSTPTFPISLSYNRKVYMGMKGHYLIL